MVRRRRANAVVVAALVVLGAGGMARGADTGMQETAKRLFASLSADQRARAVMPYDSPERLSEVFTPGRRPGVQIKELSDGQRGLVMDLIGRFTSDYGRAKAEAVAGQDKGLGGYYFIFFGDPSKDSRWAWRVAEHHLTLVHLEVDEGTEAFGPVLLGANPPTLWDDEEKAAMDLYAAMSEDERGRARLPKEAMSGAGVNASAGVRVGDLSDAAKEKVHALLATRERFFADPVKQRIDSLIAKHGGVDDLRVAFFGKAEKRCSEGGKWDFKLAGHGVLCDYENTRGHIHMTMRVREQ